MRKKQIALAAALGCTLLLAGHALAAGAGNEPTELDADTVEYDMKTGVIQATDNVLMRMHCIVLQMSSVFRAYMRDFLLWR